jgi:ABC-type lipoprotein export system ATPase subunit
MMKLKDVWRTYTQPTETVHAVAGVTLETVPGDFVFIRGHSGSGKSTLLNLVAGLDLPDRGDVVVGGKLTREMSPVERVGLRQATVGMVHQVDHLIEELTARENVSLVQEVNGADPRVVGLEADEMLDWVGLKGLGHRFPAEMSGGQRQRVGIARALAGRRTLLLADEPTGALDSNTSLGVFQLLGELASRGRTVVVVSHDERCHDFASSSYEMIDGAITKIG